MKKRFYVYLLIVFQISLMISCQSSDSYKAAIERKGIAYTRDGFLKEIKSGNKDIAQLFIKAGIDVNAKEEDGTTALMLAIEKSISPNGGDDFLIIVKQLIEKGADVNAMSLEGNALMYAAIAPQSLDVAKYLIEKGANVNAKTFAGVTALFAAAQFGNYDMTKTLIEKRADINVTITGAPSTSDIPNISFWKGLTPLMSASMMGHINVVKLFIENKADINAKNGRGDTALSLAIKGNHIDIANLLKQAGARQ